MRKLFVASIIFAALSCAAVAAQDKVTVRWHRVAPEAEAFTVLMPEPPLRVRRVIPFSKELKLARPVYEVPHRGILFSVLSIGKKETAALKTSDDFERALRHAIQQGSSAADSKFTFERKVTLNNQTARQYLVHAQGNEGMAQVYETATHYYVLLTLGARADDLMASNFFNSFTLDVESARDASDKVSINRGFSQSPSAPEPLWPVAGSPSPVGSRNGPVVLGPIGPIGPVVPSGSVRAAGPDSQSAPSSVETPQTLSSQAISGGVLNGKAISKPQPVYPPIARAARAQGVVTVQVTVDEEGYVIFARAVGGHPLLQQAAVQAARQARFGPTLLEGRPVKVNGVITYNFVLM